MQPKCPYAITKCAGDECWDFCELTERPSGRIQGCLLESGDECEEYNDFLRELKEEEDGQS